MEIRLYLAVLSIFLFYGCASVNVQEFSEVTLEHAEVMPSISEVNGEKYKVYLEVLKTKDHKKESSADLHRMAKSVVEKILLNSGNVVFVRSAKDALYRVESHLATARVSTNQVQGKSVHYADILGEIKIYKRNENNTLPEPSELKSVIEFKDSSTESVKNSSNQDMILKNAISQAITFGASEKLYKVFAARGYILAGRKDGEDFVFEVTLGGDQLSKGQRVEIHSIQKKLNPLTNVIEENDRIVAYATVVDDKGSSRVWVKVERNGENIRLGNYVKFIPTQGFSKTLNNISNKGTKMMQNFGELFNK